MKRITRRNRRPTHLKVWKEIWEKEVKPLFSNFKKSAFRLEMLSTFLFGGTEEEMKKFQAGQKPPENYNDNDWVKNLLKAKKDGRDFSRVRVVDGLPNTYLDFEVSDSWGYFREGQNIRFIFRDEIKRFKSSVRILKDFWLFDESKCYLMEYDYYGFHLGASRVLKKDVGKYVKLMEETKEASISFEDAMVKLATLKEMRRRLSEFLVK